MAKASLEERVAEVEMQLRELSAAVRNSAAVKSSGIEECPDNLTAISEKRELNPGPSLSERILARAGSAPPEERAKAPADLAEQHDHYIYGWPKG